MSAELTPQDIIRSPRLDFATRVQDMDTPTLRAELARALTVTAETLAYLGAVWRELEIRGEDLSALRTGMGQYLPLIAAGQLEAEAVVRFAGRISLLRAIQTLPLPEQRRLALGETVKVVSIGREGDLSEADVAAASLTTEQIRLAFDHGRIRSLPEQHNMVMSAKVAARRRSAPGRKYRVRVDRESGHVQVGRMTVPLDEVLDALRIAGLTLRADAPPA